MVTSRRIRIILAGVLALIVVIVGVFLLRQPSAQDSSQPALDTNDVDLIVQTLFAQTAIAQVNVDVDINLQVVTPTPTPIPTFPNEALQALQAEVRTYFNVVSTSLATNPRAYITLQGVSDEVWCVVISPPVDYVPHGFSTTARDQSYFLIRRVGLYWEVFGSRSANDSDLRQTFQSGGCSVG